MRTLSRDRLLFGGLTFLTVFVSYVLTLAPTLTFWDAGEFIATSKILGVPHPPGAPLKVFIRHSYSLDLSTPTKSNLSTPRLTVSAGLRSLQERSRGASRTREEPLH